MVMPKKQLWEVNKKYVKDSKRFPCLRAARAASRLLIVLGTAGKSVESVKLALSLFFS